MVIFFIFHLSPNLRPNVFGFYRFKIILARFLPLNGYIEKLLFLFYKHDLKSINIKVHVHVICTSPTCVQTFYKKIRPYHCVVGCLFVCHHLCLQILKGRFQFSSNMKFIFVLNMYKYFKVLKFGCSLY